MDEEKARLTSYKARVFRDYKKLLDITGLNPEIALNYLADDPEAFVPILKSMRDQIVRSEIVYEYTFVDLELDFLLIRHFFGTGKKLHNARRTKRYRTFQLMLQNLYLLQKLSIVRSFKDIPRNIISKISALNDLRNGIAHTFFLPDLKKHKRTYKGINVFTPKGLENFRNDMFEIRYFFMPWLRNYLVKEFQKET
jgi:hypothetical protein